MERKSTYTVKDIAIGLRVSDQTVRRWIKEKKLRGVRVIRRYIIHDRELRKFLGKGYEGILHDND